MKSLIVSLLLSSSGASATGHSHKHHRHHSGAHGLHHAHSHGNMFSQISSQHSRRQQDALKKPTFHQFVSLDSAVRAEGILDRVKQKFETEENEKITQEKAKKQQELRDQEIKEAEMVSKQQKLKTQARTEASLEQAGLIIQEIKKGTMDAQQLSQLMLGNVDQSSPSEEPKAPAQTSTASLPIMEVAVPQAAPPKEQQPQPAALPSIPEKQTEKVPVPESSSSNISSVVANVLKRMNSEHKTTSPAVITAPSLPNLSVKPNIFSEKKQPSQAVEHNNAPKQKQQSLQQVAQFSANDDLEDSISSIAQRVVEQKKNEANGATNEVAANRQNVDVVKQTKQILQEAQHEVYQQEMSSGEPSEGSEEADQKKKMLQDALENPISQYFANQHPEVLKTAQERHYLTDQI